MHVYIYHLSSQQRNSLILFFIKNKVTATVTEIFKPEQAVCSISLEVNEPYWSSFHVTLDYYNIHIGVCTSHLGFPSNQ